MELLIATPFCCVGAFIVLCFGFVILMTLWRSQPYSAKEMTQAEAGASDFFSHTVPTLPPWHTNALADLSCQ